MMIATLLLTCLIFLAIGWTAPPYLCHRALHRRASSASHRQTAAGTISQDLKTGFLVGSTPKSQQIAILIGTLRVVHYPRSDPDEAESVRHGFTFPSRAMRTSHSRRAFTPIRPIT